MEGVSLLAAFAAGLLSFVSPCVLPLIPGYLSFVSGVTLDDMRGTAGGATAAPAPGARRKAVVASLAFVAGFSLDLVTESDIPIASDQATFVDPISRPTNGWTINPVRSWKLEARNWRAGERERVREIARRCSGRGAATSQSL